MDSGECSCRAYTAGLKAEHDAFLRSYQDDDEARMESVSAAHPDGATSAHLCDLETSQKGRPPVTAGRMGRAFDFDKMVKAAENLLFDKSMRDSSVLNSMNRPRLLRVLPEEMPLEDRVLVHSFAELLFEDYRNGSCLHCSTLLRDATREAEGKLVLRALLGVFDQEGEPIPRELRAWSATSRFENPPRRSEGRPARNWLRDRRIIYTVATLAYLTGMEPTRERGSRCMSIFDAVALAFQRNGLRGFSYVAVKTVWEQTKDKENGVLFGPAMLKRWREQDRVRPIVARVQAILRRRRE